MFLAISFSGMFSTIGNAFKGLNSAKFASIIDKVVLPVAGVALSFKNSAGSQRLPATSPVQPSNVAPSSAFGGGNGTKWYANPAVYLGGAGAVLVVVFLLLPRGRR